jgi:drug/metabolite transporter (DMT)-like permease
MLLPVSLWEMANNQPLVWNARLLGVIAFLGIGASVISYWCWNLSIARLGASRTAMFGNLIPLFSAVEAVILLNERLTTIHIISGILVIIGLVIANLKKANSI